jgi:hypothetical protein
MAALASDQTSKILSLLSGPSDEHILAALTILPKLSPPPAPSTVATSLADKGFRFLNRLLATGLKDPEAKASYIDTSLQCYTYLLSDGTFAASLIPKLIDAQPTTFATIASVLQPASSASTKSLALNILTRLVQSGDAANKPENLFDFAKPLLVLSSDDDATKLCVLAANQLALALAPSLTSKDITIYLTLSTALSSSLQLFMSQLHSNPKFATEFETSLPLQKAARRLLTSALNNSDDEKIKTLGLTIISRLFSTNGKWAVDAANDSGALKVFIRVACGELRIVLASFLAVLEREEDISAAADEKFSEISTLTSIFLSATKYLLEIMDDEEEEEGSASTAAWASLPFDTLIHIKGSLDDAVDSMTQLMADDAVLKLKGKAAPAHLLEALTSLLQPLGCWYAENDVDDSIYARDHIKKCMANGLLVCGGDHDNLLPLMPALSKILHTDTAAGDDIGETLMLNSAVFKRLLLFLKECVSSPLPQVEGVVWVSDVLEAGAKWLSKEGKTEAAKSIAGLMPACEGFGLLYLVRAFYSSSSTTLNDDVVAKVRAASETVFSARFLTMCEGGDHDANLVEACYMIQTGDGKGELFELVCKGSKVFAEMVDFVQRQSLLV